MLQRGILIVLLLIKATHAFGYSSSDERVIDFVRSKFSSTGTGGPSVGQEPLLSDSDSESAALRALVQMDFQLKDLWGNRDYIFGYGSLRDGSIVMAAWKNRKESQNISLKELSGIYTDERLAVVQDDKGLSRWRRVREEVAGAFINVRKSEGRVAHVFPFSTSENLASTGRESINQLVLADRPIVIRFLPLQNSSRLRDSLAALPER